MHEIDINRYYTQIYMIILFYHDFNKENKSKADEFRAVYYYVKRQMQNYLEYVTKYSNQILIFHYIFD